MSIDKKDNATLLVADGNSLKPEGSSAGITDVNTRLSNESAIPVDESKITLREIGNITTNPSVFREIWGTEFFKESQKKTPWSATYGGRLAVRAVSRGVVGAAFYAAAQIWAGNQMGGRTIGDREVSGYTINKKYDDLTALEKIARGIDNTFGKAISSATKLVTGSDEKALRSVTFRDTTHYGNEINGIKYAGRSLGHEMVAVTADFAAMSFGDYMTRYAIGNLDPNNESKWIKNGHLDLVGGIKDLGANVFKAATYAAGEDIAVALPYVYVIRASRNLINHFSPGFKYLSDKGLSTGFKVNADGTKVTGDYDLEGTIDFMTRFSWYNVGTKIFRDGYNKAAKSIKTWWDNGHELKSISLSPDTTAETVSRGFVEKISDAALYLARTTIKTMIYMIPSSFVFAMIRTPQSKARGRAINPELGVLGREGTDVLDEGFTPTAGLPSSFRPIKPSSRLSEEGNPPLFFRDSQGVETPALASPFNEIRKDVYNNNVNNYYSDGEAPLHNKLTNAIGKLSFSSSEWFAKTALHKTFNEKIKGHLNPVTADKLGKNITKFGLKMGDATAAYLPYFGLKTDILSVTADTPRMDMAIDRTIRGISKLQFSEFRAGLVEATRALMRQPFYDSEREEEAKIKMWDADYRASNESRTFTNQAAEARAGEMLKNLQLNKKSIQELANKPKPTYTQLVSNKATKDWVTRDAIQKFAVETDTAGKSIN